MNKIRVFLTILCLGFSNWSPGQGPDPRPSILFAISDDQAWAFTGANGNAGVKTPTFDRVAREGVLFPYAYCSSPSCTPSRAARF
jgi:N-sulfoglucosamine sulfohydrolase